MFGALQTDVAPTLPALAPGNITAHILTAQCSIALGRAEYAATADFTRAARKTAKTAEGSRQRTSIGWAQMCLNAHDAAGRSFERALSIDSVSTLALGDLGTVHLYHKRYTQALSCFQSALRGAQQQPKVHARRGFALLGPNHLSEARFAFETALSLAPGLALAADGLQKLDQIAIGTAIEVHLQDRRTADMKV
ncbi:tetratricopeptide repeat protein [Roseobacter sp. MH60115]|uniref:tetratricopeptide repeat protein n=1 Tax=Roseobacter sp. MH60115 TaxID=2785324 RepID=UPI0018A2E737|nr:hypothetical protein [Roseobacter sp. MH60115]